jgi:hypothetical protein
MKLRRAAAAAAVSASLAVFGIQATAGASLTKHQRQAVAKWDRQSGQRMLRIIVADLSAVSTAADSNDDQSAMTACTQLSTDARRIQSQRPIPVANLEQSWSSALGDLISGGTECATSITNGDTGLMSQAVADITAATGQIEQLGKRL